MTSEIGPIFNFCPTGNICNIELYAEVGGLFPFCGPPCMFRDLRDLNRELPSTKSAPPRRRRKKVPVLKAIPAKLPSPN